MSISLSPLSWAVSLKLFGWTNIGKTAGLECRGWPRLGVSDSGAPISGIQCWECTLILVCFACNHPKAWACHSLLLQNATGGRFGWRPCPLQSRARRGNYSCIQVQLILDASCFDVFQYIHTSHLCCCSWCFHEAMEKSLRQVPPISGLHPFGAEAWEPVENSLRPSFAKMSDEANVLQVGSRSVHDRLPTPFASAREFQEVSLLRLLECWTMEKKYECSEGQCSWCARKPGL